MAVKKSELYSSLWASCDELRGGMDASQYKDYVLVLLFVKYVSDRYAGQPFSAITVPPGASFADMVALKGKPDIGDQINKKILAPLAHANKLADMPDFNDPTKLGSGKEMVDRLTNLISIFENPALDFSKNRADGDDLLGDAYEYLMRHFATESGKSKGQFYTPAEVSRVIAQLLGIQFAKVTAKTTVYDPTCGSGSLLLKVADVAAQGEGAGRVSLYGQEKDNATAGLARMNMILHGYDKAEVKQGNTLASPLFLDGDDLKTFDYVVANPPFSDKRWATGLDPDSDPFGRFADGAPPAKQGDYAYLLHILRSLKASGEGACILPHGVLFRGNAEGVIRANLIRRGYIKAIIGLPANLFYGTGIPACVLLLDKAGAATRKEILMIDASKGFVKDGNKNRLRERDIHKVVDTFRRGAELVGYSRRVPVSEIADPKNDYNLNLPRYIDSAEPEDIQDLEAHLRGGIPARDLDALADYWAVFPSVRAALFAPSGRAGYQVLKQPVAEVKAAILAHPEFTKFNAQASQRFALWAQSSAARLKAFGGAERDPKALIAGLSEGLLKAFSDLPLLDPYSVYQHLMTYWAEVMQDDCYLIAAEGWKAAAAPRLLIDDKAKGAKKLKADFAVGKKKYLTELLGPDLIIARFFAPARAALDALDASASQVEQQMDELAEEHGGDDGLLADALNDKGKLTKASAAARLKEIKKSPADADERAVLTEFLALVEQEATLRAKAKAASDALTLKVWEKYAALTLPDIQALIVDDKWIASLAAALQSELDRVSQSLTSRVRTLAERYASPLPQLTHDISALSDRVAAHLTKMGLSWN
jgi:type I restriction enzyme M protein